VTFGLRSRVTIIAAAVFVAAITAIVLTSGHYFGTVLTRAQISRAQSVAQGLALQMERILALGLSVRELRGFEQQCIETVRAHEGVAYAMIVAPDGEILFHSDREQMHTRLPPGPLSQAIAADVGSTDDRRLGLKFALSPARDPSTEVRAISVIAYPQAIINSARNEMMQNTLAVGAVVAALGLMLLYAALSRYVNKPLDEVVQAIEQLRSGETADAIRLPAAGSRELAIMVHGFNGMLDRVAARERELVAAKEAAETANRTKSEFLAMMSHELRTPMNAVLGMAELLSSTPLTERQTRYLRSINAGSSALLRILDDILNFTRAEMGELTIQHAPFALPRLVEKSVALLQETADEKGLAVAVHIDPAVPAVVIGDAGRTRQILVNLLGNALKFTDKGTVTVRVGPAGVDRIRFSVTDTGIGIDPAFRKNLYRAFSQEDTGYARKYGGTGLGLAIVKRLCDAMEGSIDMESTPGKGSTFHFELPLPAALVEARPGDNAPAAMPQGVSAATPPEPGKKRVLVVEDNRLNQDLVVGYLEESAYEITLAINGVKGVEMFQRERFDVVLMDWQMPEMDGLEATRRIREIEQARGGNRTPIVAVTAHAMSGDREACLAAGMDDYLVKPYSHASLLHTLDRWTRS
jgi:signal transduction histidine kinase/ActR/RegA family two-component response regulator